MLVNKETKPTGKEEYSCRSICFEISLVFITSMERTFPLKCTSLPYAFKFC